MQMAAGQLKPFGAWKWRTLSFWFAQTRNSLKHRAPHWGPKSAQVSAILSKLLVTSFKHTLSGMHSRGVLRRLSKLLFPFTASPTKTRKLKESSANWLHCSCPNPRTQRPIFALSRPHKNNLPGGFPHTLLLWHDPTWRKVPTHMVNKVGRVLRSGTGLIHCPGVCCWLHEARICGRVLLWSLEDGGFAEWLPLVFLKNS